MSTEILTLSPEFGLKEGIMSNTDIFGAISGKEKRYANWQVLPRTLSLSLKYQSETAVNTLWDFFKARLGRYDSFWIKFPSNKNKKITGEAVGTGNGSQTEFDLDYFPVDISSVKVYLAGQLQTSGYSVSNNLTEEKATITFDSPPGAVAITADYEYYIQVRFNEDYHEQSMIAYKLYETGVKLIEVLWNTYVPPA